MRLYQAIENGNGVSKVITASAGTISFNTTKMHGTMRQVYIKATTDSTVFDVKFIDRKNRIVKHYRDEEGKINDFPVFPVDGIYTVVIENSTVDENYDILFVVEEG